MKVSGRSRPAEDQSLFPLVIQVLAGFSKNEGELVEEEVDTVLGLLRHGFPGGIYEDMRRQFREALGQQQDLNAIGDRLTRMLTPEQKIILGVQIYDIIARSDKNHQQMPAFYGFMERLGMAAQAIEIVHQLQAGEKADQAVAQSGELPLDSSPSQRISRAKRNPTRRRTKHSRDFRSLIFSSTRARSSLMIVCSSNNTASVAFELTFHLYQAWRWIKKSWSSRASRQL